MKIKTKLTVARYAGIIFMLSIVLSFACFLMENMKLMAAAFFIMILAGIVFGFISGGITGEEYAEIQRQLKEQEKLDKQQKKADQEKNTSDSDI